MDSVWEAWLCLGGRGKGMVGGQVGRRSGGVRELLSFALLGAHEVDKSTAVC